MLQYRHALYSDIEDLIPLMVSFIKESMYKDLSIDNESIQYTLWNFMDNPNVFFKVVTKEDKIIGCLVGTKGKLPFSLLNQASETIWYVNPLYRKTCIGLGLYTEFYQWALDNDCKVIHTASPYGSNLGKAYEKQGYKMFEELYIKVLD